MKVSPVAHATFLVVGNRKLVFSEAAQRFYELNDIGAFIWCSLQDGADPFRVASELSHRGIEPAQADRFVRSAVSDWIEAGLVRSAEARQPEHPTRRRLALELANLGFLVNIEGEAPARSIVQVFGHLEGSKAPNTDPIDVTAQDDLFRITQAGRIVSICRENEVAASLKAHLTEEVLARSAPNIVLHAACLVHQGRSLLLVGRPGAGKTTLTLALAASGLGFGGDDVSLVTPDGTVQGVPFAAAVKAGAWDLVSRFSPGFDAASTHWRADRKRVRYVTPATLAEQAARPVGWVIFLNRRAGQRPVLGGIEPGESLTRLVGHAYTPDHRLTVRGAHALAGLVRNARTFDFAYSDLDEAVDAIGRALS